MNALDAVATPFASPPRAAGADAARRAAEDFEAMVIGELLKPMFQALDVDGLGGGGVGEQMFRPMLIDRYAGELAKTGGIGIADSVARELIRLQENADGLSR
jgi:peptidoglycan hydrolase FlgJ